MNRGRHGGSERGFQKLTAVLGHAKLAPKQGLRGGGSHTNYHLRTHDGNFGVKPWPACRNLRGIRLFVNAALASRLPFEVLYGIGDVNFGSINSRFNQGAVEKFPGRSNERAAVEVLIIPGLFSDQHDFAARRSGAEYGLSGIAP